MSEIIKPSLVSAAGSEEVQGHFVVTPWTAKDVPAIYRDLEHPNWAPWLEANAETLAARSVVFPEGQLLAVDPEGTYVGSLSLNRIDWDGYAGHLPARDEVTGRPTDYRATYKRDGNTLVCLYMNVAPAFKGKQVPGKLIDSAGQVAKSLGVEHLLGSFRPSGYGRAKWALGSDLNFRDYCWAKQPGSDKPVDPWLRSLWWKGVRLLAVKRRAVTIEVSFSKFYEYQQSYKPEAWYEAKSGVWECEELGSWTVDARKGTTTYTESNVWGEFTEIKLGA